MLGYEAGRESSLGEAFARLATQNCQIRNEVYLALEVDQIPFGMQTVVDTYLIR